MNLNENRSRKLDNSKSGDFAQRMILNMKSIVMNFKQMNVQKAIL